MRNQEYAVLCREKIQHLKSDTLITRQAWSIRANNTTPSSPSSPDNSSEQALLTRWSGESSDGRGSTQSTTSVATSLAAPLSCSPSSCSLSIASTFHLFVSGLPLLSWDFNGIGTLATTLLGAKAGLHPRIALVCVKNVQIVLPLPDLLFWSFAQLHSLWSFFILSLHWTAVCLKPSFSCKFSAIFLYNLIVCVMPSNWHWISSLSQIPISAATSNHRCQQCCT